MLVLVSGGFRGGGHTRPVPPPPLLRLFSTIAPPPFLYMYVPPSSAFLGLARLSRLAAVREKKSVVLPLFLNPGSVAIALAMDFFGTLGL